MNQRNEKDWLNYNDLEAKGYGSRTTVWRAVKNLKFPPPRDNGRGGKVWFPEDLDEFNESLIQVKPNSVQDDEDK